MPVYLEIIAESKKIITDSIVSGVLAGPWTIAIGLRGANDLIRDAMKDPDYVHELMRFCTQISIRFGEVFYPLRAGLSYSEAPASCSLISPKMYRTFILPYHKQIVDHFKEKKVGVGLHICGYTDPILEDMVSTGVTNISIDAPTNLAKAGRIPLVVEAIRLLKEEVGDQVAIGAWVLGPYTLAGQLVDIGDLAKMAFKKTDMVHEILDTLAKVLIEISRIYRSAGADYMTIREMGAGPDILSPRMFKTLIRPHLEQIFNSIESPKILHICGSTDSIVDQMALCGADAISVDQKNNVAESRKKIGNDPLLLGNFDPYGPMVQMDASQVEQVIKKCIDDGVDALWPGCDFWPEVKKENMEALVAATQKYGKLG